MFNSIENFKEDYVIQVIQPLIDLNIPSICKMIEASIYSIKDDGRFEYQEYFTQSRFHEYLEAKKTPINAENKRFLKSFPRPVIPFYELLETLKVVSNTFEELDTIPLVGIEGTIGLPQKAWTLIQTNIPMIYQRLNQLSKSHILIHQLLQPLLNPTNDLWVQTQVLVTEASEHLNQLYNSNQESLSLMLPKKEGGLAALSKLVILTPYFLKELTQYVERGDTVINFDPKSSEIIELENIYVNALKNITKSKQTIIQGLYRLIEVLPKTVSDILKETNILSEASAKKLNQQTIQLEEQLFKIQAQLEAIEENLGLKKDTLITPYKKQKILLLDHLNQRIIQTIQELPKQLKPYEDLTDFISRIKLIPNLDDLKITPKSAVRAARRATQNIQNTIKNTQKYSAEIVLYTSKTIQNTLFGLPPSEVTPLAPQKEKIVSLNTLQFERLKRFKKINLYQKNRYEAFIEFFKVLHNAKKYPVSQNVQAFQNLLKSSMSGRYYSMVQTIQDLTEQQKTTLKNSYPYIQEFLQSESPHLDAAIVQSLEAEHDDAHVYLPNQSTDAHYLIRLLCMVGLVQYTLQYFTQGNMNWISASMMLMYIGYLYTSPISSQLDIILKYQKNIEIAIGQNQTHEDRQIKTIEARFKEEEPDLNVTAFSQTITIPETIPTIQEPYDSAFTLLKKNRPSQKVFDFLQNTLYPLLRKTLNKQKIKQLLNDDHQPLQLPLTFSHKDDEIIQNYKQLINAFYNLTLMLDELEKVDAHVYNEDNSIILQSWNVVSILLPILTSGLQTIYEIQNSLKNQRFLKVKEECLRCINDVKNIINAKYPLTKIPKPINESQEEHFDAYQSWLKSQKTYQRKIHKRNIPIENQIPQKPPTEIAVTAITDPDLTFEDLVRESTKSLKIINSLHQKLFDNKPVPTIQDLEEDSIVACKEFIKELRFLIKVHIHHGVSRKGHNSIHYIKSFVIDKDSFNKLLNTFSKSKPVDTLNFIEGFVQVCEELYLSHQEAGLTTILQIYDLLSYHLLTMADDFEHNHLQYGIISLPLQEKIDDAFEALIERIAPEKLFEFWTLKNVFEARIKYQEAHIEKALHDLEELQKSQRKIKNLIQRRFKHLKSILQDFNPHSIKKLEESQEFQFFLRNYTYLQPILSEINPEFDQTYFLANIKNHRPETFVVALKSILAHEKEIRLFFHSQIKHQKTAIDSYIKLRLMIKVGQRVKQEKRFINHAIQQVIKQQYQIELGSHHHYYAEKLIETFWKDPNRLKYLTPILKSLDLSDSKTFQDDITKALKIVGQQEQLKTIFSILQADHRFTIELENEIKLSYRTKSNPPSKYQFVLENNTTLTDTNKIYITKGYQFVLKERLPEDEALEYSHIYYDNKGNFVFKSVNGDIIQGEVPEEEGLEFQNLILSTYNLSNNQLFYRTKKIPILEPVPQEFIDKNKIAPQDPNLIKTLNDYLREFLRFSDSKSYTDEERPCLKQKISYLQTKLSKAKKRNIPEVIEGLIKDKESQAKLTISKASMKYRNHRASLQYRKNIQYFNQIMFIDDQLDKARQVNSDNIYEDLQNNIRNKEISPEERFYQFSIAFKAKKRFFGGGNQHLDILAKKIWRGAVIVQNLESIINRFPKNNREKIQKLIEILKNAHKPFISLDKRLEQFFDLISQDEYLELFRKPQSIFDRILGFFGIPSAQQQFLENLRKQNRFLDTCMTLREIDPNDNYQLKKILHNSNYTIQMLPRDKSKLQDNVIYLMESPKAYFIKGIQEPIFLPEDTDLLNHDSIKMIISKMTDKTQDKRLKLFSQKLTSSILTPEIEARLYACLPKEPQVKLDELIHNKKNQFLNELKTLESIYTKPELQTKIKTVSDSAMHTQQYKKALKDLNEYLKTNPPRSFSSLFYHMVGQKTEVDIIMQKVSKQVNAYEEAKNLKSSKR